MSDSPATMHPWGEPALRLTLMPRDTNAWGTIFGGVILSYIDLAGGVEARKHANHTFVTVAMREVAFHEPVFVGDLVSFYTRTERVGRTSVTVKVIVEAIRGHEAGRRVKVTEAEAIYVAIDESRRPIPIQASGSPHRASAEPGSDSPPSLIPLADPRSYPSPDPASAGEDPARRGGKRRRESDGRGAARTGETTKGRPARSGERTPGTAETRGRTGGKPPARRRTGRGHGEKRSVRGKPGR